MTQTPDGRMAALAHATAIREHRARIKRQLAMGNVKLSAVLRSNDELLATMKLAAILVATPGIGKVKARRVCHQLHLSTSMPLENLTEARREKLLARLHADHPKLAGRI